MSLRSHLVQTNTTKWMVIFCLGGIVVLAGRTTSATPVNASRVVEAERFLLRDTNGKVRAALQSDPNGPNLMLCDENEKAQLLLVITKAGPAITLTDKLGTPRLALMVPKNGSPRIEMYDRNDGKRMVLCEIDGSTMITLADATDARLVMRTDSAGVPAVWLFNKDQTIAWSAAGDPQR